MEHDQHMDPHDSDRVIIMNYPSGAGGKFITYCLALHERVLCLGEANSIRKLRDRTVCAEHGRMLYDNTQGDRHQEEWEDMLKDPQGRERITSRFCARVLLAGDHWVPKINHLASLDTRYRNARQVILHNTGRLLRERLRGSFRPDNAPETTWGEAKAAWWGQFTRSIAHLPGLSWFDMDTVYHPDAFARAIQALLDDLGVTGAPIDLALLERYRALFLDSRSFSADHFQMWPE